MLPSRSQENGIGPEPGKIVLKGKDVPSEVRGRPLRPNDIRFDGVHLTTLGKTYIMGLIQKQMLATPPKCASDPVQQARVADQLSKTNLATNLGSDGAPLTSR